MAEHKCHVSISEPPLPVTWLLEWRTLPVTWLSWNCPLPVTWQTEQRSLPVPWMAVWWSCPLVTTGTTLSSGHMTISELSSSGHVTLGTTLSSSHMTVLWRCPLPVTWQPEQRSHPVTWLSCGAVLFRTRDNRNNALIQSHDCLVELSSSGHVTTGTALSSGHMNVLESCPLPHVTIGYRSGARFIRHTVTGAPPVSSSGPAFWPSCRHWGPPRRAGISRGRGRWSRGGGRPAAGPATAAATASPTTGSGPGSRSSGWSGPERSAAFALIYFQIQRKLHKSS